jgi:tetraprenyl-beta-curcumene synthase
MSTTVTPPSVKDRGRRGRRGTQAEGGSSPGGQRPELPGGLHLAGTMLRRVLPAVRDELAGWRVAAAAIPDRSLREQAQASIESKEFHCQAGAALALLAGERWREAVGFVVAMQTLSDYLDNLCDSNGQHSATCLRRLHLGMVHAADPPGDAALPATGELPLRYPDCYAWYPQRADGGYYGRLIAACQGFVLGAGLGRGVRRAGRQLMIWYRELQAAKHAPWPERLPRLLAWHRGVEEAANDQAGRRAAGSPGPTDEPLCPELPLSRRLMWPEFAAACGSTLPLFALYCRAAGIGAGSGGRGAQGELRRILQAYYPWIAGLHIMLDGLIDRAADRVEDQLNLTAYYSSEGERRHRLRWLAGQAADAAAGLPDGHYHRTVVDGLLAVYLSDPKASDGELRRDVASLLSTGGAGARALWSVCRGVRLAGL